ncbi:MAG: hypothetical protein E7016_01510 [Alphaproteobacteria bacterium]|nr:hypothetical protein [Alphaproteobacteria bacterium]
MIKLFLFIFLVFPLVSEATTCVKDYAGTNSCVENENTAGDCETLGYSSQDVSGCKNYLYCPFNTNYKRCVAGGNELDCAELGYTSENKAAWCSTIITCPNDSTLTACVGQCVYNDICIDKTDEITASMPTNAQLKYTNCTACGETRQIVTDWECSSGYGYVTNAYTCGSTITSTTLRAPLCMHCNTKYVTYSDCARAIACKNATGKSCTVTPTGLVGC